MCTAQLPSVKGSDNEPIRTYSPILCRLRTLEDPEGDPAWVGIGPKGSDSTLASTPAWKAVDRVSSASVLDLASICIRLWALASPSLRSAALLCSLSRSRALIVRAQ